MIIFKRTKDVNVIPGYRCPLSHQSILYYTVLYCTVLYFTILLLCVCFEMLRLAGLMQCSACQDGCSGITVDDLKDQLQRHEGLLENLTISIGKPGTSVNIIITQTC